MHEDIGFSYLRPARIGMGLMLIGLGLLILKPFLAALIWASVLAILCMPIQQWRLVRLPQRTLFVPGMIILVLCSVLLEPVVWLLVRLQDEAALAYQALSMGVPIQTSAFTSYLDRIPVLGPVISDVMRSIPTEAQELVLAIKNVLPSIGRGMRSLLIELSDQFLQFFMTGVGLFLFLRDGLPIMNNLRLGLTRILGANLDLYFRTIHRSA